MTLKHSQAPANYEKLREFLLFFSNLNIFGVFVREIKLVVMDTTPQKTEQTNNWFFNIINSKIMVLVPVRNWATSMFFLGYRCHCKDHWRLKRLLPSSYLLVANLLLWWLNINNGESQNMQFWSNNSEQQDYSFVILSFWPLCSETAATS